MTLRRRDVPAHMASRGRVSLLACALLVCATLLAPSGLRAQERVGSDSSTRVRRYYRDLGFGIALGFVYAGVDQWRDDPAEWGDGWSGYQKRVASDVGEFVIQESVTDLLAAALHRPLDYQRCRCRGFGRRLGWALQSSVTDPLPNGHRALAVPRIVGAYAGSVSQAAWRPAAASGRARTALVNGTISLVIGAGINMFYELRR